MLNGQIKRLLKKFLSKFVQTPVIQKYDLQDIPYGEEDNQYTDDNIAVGLDTHTYLSEVQDVLSPTSTTRFFK